MMSSIMAPSNLVGEEREPGGAIRNENKLVGRRNLTKFCRRMPEMFQDAGRMPDFAVA
jgi:hypothetical protein